MIPLKSSNLLKFLNPIFLIVLCFSTAKLLTFPVSHKKSVINIGSGGGEPFVYVARNGHFVYFVKSVCPRTNPNAGAKILKISGIAKLSREKFGHLRENDYLCKRKRKPQKTMAAMFTSKREALDWLKAVKERKRMLEEESQLILEKIHNERLG